MDNYQFDFEQGRELELRNIVLSKSLNFQVSFCAFFQHACKYGISQCQTAETLDDSVQTYAIDIAEKWLSLLTRRVRQDRYVCHDFTQSNPGKTEARYAAYRYYGFDDSTPRRSGP